MGRKGIIELEGMEFHSDHGVLEREKAAGNLFIVDFKGELEMGAAASSDRLDDTLNYSLIYDAIAQQMKIHSDLLENLAARIVDTIAERFTEFDSFSVRVSKQRPPVRGIVQWSRVTLTHCREM